MKTLKFFTSLLCYLCLSSLLAQKSMPVLSTTQRQVSLSELEPSTYNYNFTYPVCSELICGGSCPNQVCLTPQTYTPGFNYRYFISAFAPRMTVSSGAILKDFDFHQGSDIVDKKVLQSSDINAGIPLPEIRCMCDGVIHSIIEGPDEILEDTDQGRSVVVKCNTSFQGNPWGNVYLAFRHLSSIHSGIVPGVTVNKHQLLGIMGQSGTTTNNHLHLSVQRLNDAGQLVNVHPDRVFNPAQIPHLLQKLDASQAQVTLLSSTLSPNTAVVNSGETQGNWALFRIALPFNQSSIRAISVIVNGTSYKKTYDTEVVSEDIRLNTSAERYDHIPDLKLFVFPFNRGQSAYHFFDPGNSNNIITSFNNQQKWHSGKVYAIPNSGIYQKPAYVLDVLANNLPSGFQENQLIVEITDIWGNTIQGQLPCNKPAVTDLEVKNKTENSAVLKCNLVANRYNWQYRRTGNNAWIDLGITTNNQPVSNLLAGIQYEVKVRVECTAASGFSPYSDSLVFTTLCNPPTTGQLSFENQTGTSVTLKCTKTAYRYDFRYKRASSTGGFTELAAPPASQNYFNLTGLGRYSGGYVFQGRVQCSDGGEWSWSTERSTEWSDNKPFNLNCALPSSTEMSVTNIENTTATLDFDPAGLTTNFPDHKFEWKLSSSDTWRPRMVAITGDNSFANIANLTEGTSYHYRVSLYCAGSWIGPSIIKSFRTTGGIFTGGGGFTGPTDDIQLSSTTTNTGVSISPNPNSGAFNLKIDLERVQDVKVTILDVMGKTVFSQVLGSGSNFNQPLQLNGLSKGMYFLMIPTQQGILSEKILIE